MFRISAVLLLISTISPGLSEAQGADEKTYEKNYARLWSVQAAEEGLFALTLTPEIYGQVQRPNLSDLAAFNAAGEALAFEPLASVMTPPEPEWRSANIFALPARAKSEEGLSLQVERDAQGSLVLRAQTQPHGDSGEAFLVLVDTGVSPEQNLRLRTLEVELDPDVEWNALVRVDASSDLQSWRTVSSGAALLQLVQNGRILRKQQVELGGIGERYLRMERVDTSGPLPIVGVRVEVQDASAPEPVSRQELVVRSTRQEGSAFLYRLPSRIPIESLNVRLADENQVAAVRISSRESADDPWYQRGNLTAFRLRAAGVELDNEPLSLHRAARQSRARWWRVESEATLEEAPELIFHYRPERWALLTRGEGPHVVAAGSLRAERQRLPLKTLMAPIRAKYGDAWQPSEVGLGESVLAAGDAALEPSASERFSGAALWALLIASALAIAVMVLRLMREQSK